MVIPGVLPLPKSWMGQRWLDQFGRHSFLCFCPELQERSRLDCLLWGLGDIPLHARYWTAIICCQVSDIHNPPTRDMTEHSEVRCAILLPFIPLKVRRMKSPALLWATAGPVCRSLKHYWVSAKALTLPISHHGSSQLSLPSGLIGSPERINTQPLCSLCTRASLL